MKMLLYRLRHRAAAFTHDLLMVPVAWFGGLWLRFNLETIPEPFWRRGLALLPLILVVHAVMFLYFGLYRGVWRFASMPDFIRIGKAVLAAVTVSAALVFLLTGMAQVPRSLFFLHGLLLLFLLGTPRFCYRWLKDHRLFYRKGARVLIVGAGKAGEMIARELVQDPEGKYRPVVFVDDDPRKRGTEVRGLRVVANCRRIPEVVSRYDIDLIFIAVPSADTQTMRRIVTYCEAGGKPFRTLPRLHDLLSGRAILQELREVSIEDLLGREPVSLDWETIRGGIYGRRVLISGGGGSIGSELCRQVAGLQPASLVILERSEFNLYRIDRELRERFPGLTRHAHLSDIGEEASVDHLLARYQPEVILHAAAYKHVPLLEYQPREAIRNNLFGTITMAQAAERHGCQTFVLISTDKAVKPSNIMGATKFLAEVYCQNAGRRAATRFVTVRFGNVLGSAGSVVPLFQQQIKTGGPVTVTHPEVERYFMTIPEASQLILQAGAVGQGREVFVLDMGEPVNIRELAEQMILLSGKTPGADIPIEYIGLLPGEKLTEELFAADEKLLRTPYPKLLLAQSREVDEVPFTEALEELRRACAAYDENRLRVLIWDLVRELSAPARRVDIAHPA